ncbi:hypothetical protein J4E91_004200 [Alternaria rosae]|nr:hypothetical protein J4E91_004200 [Alternaria rosae]
MHWRHLKWRAPWQKRHLSVLEAFRAEEAAKGSAVTVRRTQDENIEYVTGGRLEDQASTWNRCIRSIRYLRNKPWRDPSQECFEHDSVKSGGETVTIARRADAHNEETQESGSERWEGDYTSLLAEYGI